MLPKARLTNEWIQAGVIGEVREVHVWSDRAGKLWKQGISRPAESPRFPKRLIGTSGSDRFRNVPTIQLTPLLAGAAGGTSAPVRWETWGVISSIIPCGHSNSDANFGGIQRNSRRNLER